MFRINATEHANKYKMKMWKTQIEIGLKIGNRARANQQESEREAITSKKWNETNARGEKTRANVL